jgi:hypothetical protein
MTDRLDDIASDLFRAGREEHPSVDAKRRVLDAIHSRSAPRRRMRFAGATAVVAIAAGWAVYAAVTPPPENEPLALRAEPTRANPTSIPSAPHAPASAPSKTTPPLAPRPDRRVAPPAPSARKPALAAEVRLLEKARGELRAGNPTATLATLDEYARTMRGGVMTAEATLLRIEALSRAGRTTEADALARRFVEANPHSALSDRARQFVKTDTGDEP